MWHKLDDVENFLTSLYAADVHLAEQVRRAGCPCGGQLHRADFPRKARGVAEGYEYMFSRRFSFCCAERECRKRNTPPSVRFFGRRLYVAAVVIACSVGWSAPEQTPVPERTVRRWVGYFRREFVASTFWQAARARFMPPVVESELPASLVERFTGELAALLHRVLEFLAPVTTSRAGVLMRR